MEVDLTLTLFDNQLRILMDLPTFFDALFCERLQWLYKDQFWMFHSKIVLTVMFLQLTQNGKTVAFA